MSIKKRGLGRGLDALLSQPKTSSGGKKISTLPIELLQRGKYQPRTEFDPEQLQELADSINAQGLIQPIIVRPLEGESYEILAGERRWRAAQMAGLQNVAVVVNDVDDRSAMAISLIENIQREDLNPLDESEALLRLVEEFEMTHQQAADAVGRSRVAVSNLLRLLELELSVKNLLRKGHLEMGHARALLALPTEDQAVVGLKVSSKGLSVRATEALVKKHLKKEAGPAVAHVKDVDIDRLQQSVAEKLGAKVDITHKQNGVGKIIIHFSSMDELDGVLTHIK